MSYEYPVGHSIARKMEPVFLEARLNTKLLVRMNGGKKAAKDRRSRFVTAQKNQQMNVNEGPTLENTWLRPFLGSIMNEVQTKVLCKTELGAFTRQNVSVYIAARTHARVKRLSRDGGS